MEDPFSYTAKFYHTHSIITIKEQQLLQTLETKQKKNPKISTMCKPITLIQK